ncbi:hypothetical protein KFK09_020762 [Dendrobium nobile]|uniref:Uncharacterized protein n=1 Tax=Dendrobium nobile TaxID=94219 RepID=A0A8T3ANB9_DENNO|nr:hypothetical protein KFK09_020762 [Dendrobium nobile]
MFAMAPPNYKRCTARSQANRYKNSMYESNSSSSRVCGLYKTRAHDRRNARVTPPPARVTLPSQLSLSRRRPLPCPAAGQPEDRIACGRVEMPED